MAAEHLTSAAFASATEQGEPPPLLRAQLQPGERLLWFQPLHPEAQLRTWRSARFMAVMVTGLGVLMIPITGYVSWVIIHDEADYSLPRLALGLSFWWLIFVVMPLCVGLWMWRHAVRPIQPAFCALSDRRALQTAGADLALSEPWTLVGEPRSYLTGPGYGGVFWRIVERERRTKEGIEVIRDLIGFRDIAAPETAASVVADWRADRGSASAQVLRRFAAAATEGRLPEAEQAGDAWTLSAPHLGFAVTLPGDWQASVDRFRFVGAMPIGTGWRPWNATSRDWNALVVAPPIDAGARIIAHEGPLVRSFEDVRDSDWGELTSGGLISADSDLRIGPWRGFAVARASAKAGLSGISLAVTGVARRDIWLDLSEHHLQISLVAGERDAAAQGVLNAIAASLRPC